MTWYNPWTWGGESDASDAGVVPDTFAGGVKDSLSRFIPKYNVPTDYNLGQSQYNFAHRKFPSDLGSNSETGHYIVININVQNQSNMNKINGSVVSTPLKGEISKTDALRFNIDSKFYGNDATKNYSQRDNPIALGRNTTRIAESIAIYMPNSELTFTDVHDFDNLSLTAFGSIIAGGVFKFGATGLGALALGAIAGKRGARAGGAAGAAIGDMLTNGQTIGNIAQINGTPINPKVEVLYANTAQREFTFEFLMAPVSPDESRTVQEIIRTLRFHAAPELRAGNSAVDSLFYIPPSEFDITFYNRGKENMAIPRINTCALTQVDVSYAPTGIWSTFHNGYPVQIRMMLRFREVEVAHKLRIAQGF